MICCVSETLFPNDTWVFFLGIWPEISVQMFGLHSLRKMSVIPFCCKVTSLCVARNWITAFCSWRKIPRSTFSDWKLAYESINFLQSCQSDSNLFKIYMFFFFFLSLEMKIKKCNFDVLKMQKARGNLCTT